MEKYPTIDQYISTEMSEKIVRRAQSPTAGLLVFAIGIVLLALMHNIAMPDNLQALVLTLGIAATGVGLVLAAMCVTQTLWHWHFQPTNSRMRRRKLYLDSADHNRCLEALSSGNVESLVQLRPIGTSNVQLQVLYTRDCAVALLQVGGLDTGHFVPESPVVQVSGDTVAALEISLSLGRLRPDPKGGRRGEEEGVS